MPTWLAAPCAGLFVLLLIACKNKTKAAASVTEQLITLHNQLQICFYSSAAAFPLRLSSFCSDSAADGADSLIYYSGINSAGHINVFI